MILHLFDDEKVVNRCIEIFEKSLPDENNYICFISSSTPYHVSAHNSLTFIRNINDVDEDVINVTTKVLIHYLSPWKYEFINKFIKKSIPCYWLIWGGDLYNQILQYKGYQLYYTKSCLDYYSVAYIYLSKVNIYTNYLKQLLLFIKERIQYIVAECDYDKAKQFISENINAKQIKGFGYYAIDRILGDLKGKSIIGNNITIGNSASFTNNHLYAFKFLKKLSIGNRIVSVPLSYGGNTKYKDLIIKRGTRTFKNFNPIMCFMPLEEYNKFMLGSSVFIFSSWRQEAFGNIVAALYLGAKVFISNRSPLFNELFCIKKLKIFELEKISQTDIDTSMNSYDIINNRIILDNILSEKVIINMIRSTWHNK